MVRTNPILLVKITYLLFFFSILFFSPLMSSLAQDGEATDVRVTHGPLLGRPGPDTMSLWVRTEKAGKVTVFYGTKKDRLDKQASLVTTDLAKDRTGIITLQKLTSNTRYYYRIADHQLDGSFRTLPHAADFMNPDGNPDGLFNFKFEFACGNNQNGNGNSAGPTVPVLTH
jgi:alkaline phosphatase D